MLVFDGKFTLAVYFSKLRCQNLLQIGFLEWSRRFVGYREACFFSRKGWPIIEIEKTSAQNLIGKHLNIAFWSLLTVHQLSLLKIDLKEKNIKQSITACAHFGI